VSWAALSSLMFKHVASTLRRRVFKLLSAALLRMCNGPGDPTIDMITMLQGDVSGIDFIFSPPHKVAHPGWPRSLRQCSAILFGSKISALHGNSCSIRHSIASTCNWLHAPYHHIVVPASPFPSFVIRSNGKRRPCVLDHVL
jgi:hypothetical protein